MALDDLMLRKKIALNLFLITEKILKKEHPFEDFPVLSQSKSFFYKKLLQYDSELSSDIKQKVIQALMRVSNGNINRVLDVDEVFVKNDICDEDIENIEKRFEEWVRNKEGDKKSVYLNSKTLEKISVVYIAKEVMKKRMPQFTYRKGVVKWTQISFCKKIRDKRCIVVNFDTGKMGGGRFSVSIGFNDPAFLMDIATFNFWTQSWFVYSTQLEFITQLNSALDFIDIILPHFEEALLDVIFT